MFIYKITVIPLNQIYIGMDTDLEYKKSRWKDHCRESQKNTKRKIHLAMKQHGLDQCTYEVVEGAFLSLGQLALAEIKYIEQYDSYKNGLNSSRGGDGLGHTGWYKLTEEEMILIKTALGDHFREYNKIKWANTTPEQRKEMVKRAFTPEINARRAESLKEYYKAVPGAIENKVNKILKWQQENKEEHKKIARANGAKGAAKVSKRLEVETEDGKVLYFLSKSDFQRQTGQWAKTVLEKSKNGEFYNGYKAKEV
jgi:group I intron endonuclease